jgi:hypothetical protein
MLETLASREPSPPINVDATTTIEAGAFTVEPAQVVVADTYVEAAEPVLTRTVIEEVDGEIVGSHEEPVGG